MITPADLRNPKRQSGYNHVSRCGGQTPGPKPFMAIDGRGHGHGRGSGWFGKRRATALEAAQDYCDHRNGLPQKQQPLPPYSTPSVDMGNTKRHAPPPEKITIKREKYKGPHDLYDVIFESAGGNFVCRKVGITARGHSRYLDICKTLGLSIRPHAPARTFPSEAAARVAEDRLKATVARDPKWVRVGKEAFIPADDQEVSA